MPGDAGASDRRTLKLWHVDPSAVRDPELLARYREILSDAEQARYRHFRAEPQRQRYLVTRALVRSTLSRYADVGPAAWSFRERAGGRPELSGPEPVPPLHFNVSHTDGLVACLVGPDRELGVDVENLERHRRALDIADRHFAPDEVEALHALPADARRTRFLELWTLKEAYLKARGVGLRLPLAHFSFRIEARGAIGVEFDARLDDDPRSWQFRLARPTPRHVLAVAARRASGAELALVARACVPLARGSG